MPKPNTHRTLLTLLATDTDVCIVWPHSLTTRGYPQMTHPSGERYAHRAALLETVGPCPDGMEAAHSCGNRSCVNPRHLRWTTPSDNNYDRSRHGTMPRGEQHHRATLTDRDASDAIARYYAGESSRALGAEYGVDRATIERWAHGKSRAHLTQAE